MRGRNAPIAVAAWLAGALQAASFWPFDAWWLQIAALAIVVALLLQRDARRDGATRHAASIGFAFGFGWFVTGVSWMFVSMHRYGGMPAPLAALALLLFAAYLASFFGLVAAMVSRADRLLRDAAAAPLVRTASLGLLFAGAWSLAEMARGWLFTGFPWLAIGYAHVDGPLAGFAPLFGVYGICALAALAAFGLAAVFSGPASARALALAFLALPLLVGSALRSLDWSQPHGAPLHVRLLQGNVPQEMKFDAARSLAAMNAYVAGVRRSDAALSILPETAWTVPWSRTPQPLRETLASHLAATGSSVAIGMPLFAEEADARTRDGRDGRASGAAPATPSFPALTNSVAVVDASGAIVWRYDKRHLVPFGEFVPFGFGWFVDLMHIPLGDFARGSAAQPPLVVDGQRIAFDICYEDLFGEEIAAQVRGGASILANVSNIAWFGDSHALPQHLQIARMRTIELARPMLRATNTGVTAAIGADGRVLDTLKPYTAGALDLAVQGYDGLTPYARFGNTAPFALAAALGVAGGVAPLRRARLASGRAPQTR